MARYMKIKLSLCISALVALLLITNLSQAQIGRRFPSERKLIKDPVTGVLLTFLTSEPVGDSKIYQTHNQWTSDGQWLIFRSGRVKGEAMAVNEKTGDQVQVTEGGFTGMLCVARKSMKLYYLHNADTGSRENHGALQLIETNLEKVFTDSKAGHLQPATVYQRVCGTIPAAMNGGNDLALDANENKLYFRVSKEEAAKHLAPGTKIESNYGPRNMGAGPSGLAAMDVQ